VIVIIVFGQPNITMMNQPHLDGEEGEQLQKELVKLMEQPPLTGKDLEMQNDLERRLTPALLSMSSDQITDLMKFCLRANNESEGLIEALGGKKEDQRSSGLIKLMYSLPNYNINDNY